MRLNALLAVAVLLLGGWVSQSAQANFGDASGFSGRSGVTCASCHTPAPALQPAAKAVLEGLPDSWVPGATYKLTIRVEGGPQAMPAPQAQGGFALASNGGRFELLSGTQDLLIINNDSEVVYRPAGTLQREWEAQWIAPELSAPRDIQFWLGVIAANGNHLVAAGDLDDGGERGDSADALTRTLPAGTAAHAQWAALPLLAPQARANQSGSQVSILGNHADENATTLGFSLDGGVWQTRETAPTWRIDLPDLPAGSHRISLRSEGVGRTSPPIDVAFQIDGDSIFGTRGTPAPVFALTALILLSFVYFIRRFQP